MYSALLPAIIQSYPALEKQPLQVSTLGEGLIHETLLLEGIANQWILQGFNEAVFNFPERIDFNLSLVSAHTQNQAGALPFLLPLPVLNKDGQGLTEIEGKKYRLFDFVQGKTVQQIDKPDQAYCAAQAYGEFAKWAKEISGESMQETIPNFHRLDLRYQMLQQVSQGKSGLSDEENEILEFYLGQKPLIDWYLSQVKELPLRVTHNDTKINNLIFSEDLNSVKALIDLDTVMGGYLMYDFGDLVRTVACSFPETSTQWNEIQLFSVLFEKLLDGYWQGIRDFANLSEAKSLIFGGEIMTLIMGLRFFTDHLQGNIYYRVSYPQQNFHRAKNQMIFLQSQQEKQNELLEIWAKVTGLVF